MQLTVNNTIDVAHSAIGHSQSPDPLSGTCFQTNLETPTALSLHSDSHWRHSSSTSISVLQRIRGVTIMRYINLHFTYLLTYLLTNSVHQWWLTTATIALPNDAPQKLVADVTTLQWWETVVVEMMVVSRTRPAWLWRLTLLLQVSWSRRHFTLHWRLNTPIHHHSQYNADEETAPLSSNCNHVYFMSSPCNT